MSITTYTRFKQRLLFNSEQPDYTVFVFPVLCVSCLAYLVIATQSSNEYNRGNILKAVNPFSSFCSLASDVDHDKVDMVE